ncbi:MAG TPA: penicillin-binding protein activator, partial [Usitatibacter sp.]|nr:penicillin-binding protein activator [Usitatibacter sp.]
LPPPQGEVVRPENAPEPQDIDPETGFARSTVVRPLREFPQAAPGAPAPQGAAPVPQAAVPGPRAPGHIALILPTASPTLGRLADAVRQGFAAAVRVGGREGPPVDLIAVDNEGPALIAACRQAQAGGSILVIAAITRDGATELANSECAREPVLELNEPQGIPAEALPRNLYTISLSIEHEARQVALMAVADGRRSASVIASSTPLAKRVEEAFEREWTRAAGELQRIRFDGDAEDAQRLRATLENANADMAFIALEPAQARAIRPYIPATLPLYATSLSVNPRAETLVNLDLQGLRYVEMPWFVQPDHPAVMVYPQPAAPLSVDQERLYAFGIDAYRLSLHLLRGEARRAPLDGVTGRITLGPGNAFERNLTPAEVDGGHVIALRNTP